MYLVKLWNKRCLCNQNLDTRRFSMKVQYEIVCLHRLKDGVILFYVQHPVLGISSHLAEVSLFTETRKMTVDGIVRSVHLLDTTSPDFILAMHTPTHGQKHTPCMIFD